MSVNSVKELSVKANSVQLEYLQAEVLLSPLFCACVKMKRTCVRKCSRICSFVMFSASCLVADAARVKACSACSCSSLARYSFPRPPPPASILQGGQVLSLPLWLPAHTLSPARFRLVIELVLPAHGPGQWSSASLCRNVRNKDGGLWRLARLHQHSSSAAVSGHRGVSAKITS